MPPVLDRRPWVQLHADCGEKSVAGTEDAGGDLMPTLCRSDAGDVDHAVGQQERMVEFDRDVERLAT